MQAYNLEKRTSIVGWMNDSVIHHFSKACRVTLALTQPTYVVVNRKTSSVSQNGHHKLSIIE